MKRFVPASLTVRVAAGVVLLVAVVSVLIGVLTTAAISSYLTKQLDTKVMASHGRALGVLTNGGGDKPPPDVPHGQDAGTVTVYRESSDAIGNVITAAGDVTTLTTQAITVLGAVPTGDANDSVDVPGLSLARSITEAHQGTLTLTSHPGNTNFELALPRC